MAGLNPVGDKPEDSSHNHVANTIKTPLLRLPFVQRNMTRRLALISCIFNFIARNDVDAFPFGAGSCAAGDKALGIIHTYNTQVRSDSIADYGLELRLDRHKLEPGVSKKIHA